MINIEVTEKDKDEFQVKCIIEARSSNKYINEVVAIIDELVKVDEQLFTSALMKSSYYKIVCEATKDMEIVIHEDRKQDTSD